MDLLLANSFYSHYVFQGSQTVHYIQWHHYPEYRLPRPPLILPHIPERPRGRTWQKSFGDMKCQLGFSWLMTEMLLPHICALV